MSGREEELTWGSQLGYGSACSLELSLGPQTSLVVIVLALAGWMQKDCRRAALGFHSPRRLESDSRPAHLARGSRKGPRSPRFSPTTNLRDPTPALETAFSRGPPRECGREARTRASIFHPCFACQHPSPSSLLLTPSRTRRAGPHWPGPGRHHRCPRCLHLARCAIVDSRVCAKSPSKPRQVDEGSSLGVQEHTSLWPAPSPSHLIHLRSQRNALRSALAECGGPGRVWSRDGSSYSQEDFGQAVVLSQAGGQLFISVLGLGLRAPAEETDLLTLRTQRNSRCGEWPLPLGLRQRLKEGTNPEEPPPLTRNQG
ncbi:uncharacterized protein LOC122701746 [Cervus elaphus]|uniref:uncharacterized protein LOC122701746 n=1 Tax=Cervus elaphus TaxID=9860 RepID=UPI001CC31ECB|nr:uncharacterized protein LOC122701746 [Cervus elaphus]